ncbi:MAG: proline--tRNA ligase [Candidatus Omnitrophica bacterium]|nr:proline--tRNA ligase [Candidatus Omnitrophota bacterium]
MKWSQTIIPTLRQPPKDAEATSHKLMLRAGLIRQLSSGVYNYLPLGWRVLRKVIELIRDEMDRAGAVELFMPSLQPSEIWKQTGRYESLADDKFSFKNRVAQEYVLAPTHEECITSLMAETVNSYRQLPITAYQIQTKFRDEARPRFGVIRSKEFIMKDAYSFDADEAGLDKSYEIMYRTYERIFTRAGLQFEIVQADPGLMGGNFSHEFMLLADFGEDIVAKCSSCPYRASRDIAAYRFENSKNLAPAADAKVPRPEKFDTPNLKTIEEISTAFKVKPAEMIKSLIYVIDGGEPVMALLRGDHEANEAKIRRLSGAATIRLATSQEIEKATGAPVGYVGPVGVPGKKLKILSDSAIMQLTSGVTGANESDRHLRNVVPGRDFSPHAVGDLRYAVEGDRCPACENGRLHFVRAMEIGHVFKLGIRYSKPLKANFLSREGREQPFIMGCYGIGVNRILAGAIEQNHDENGIIWPESIAPFHVELLTVNHANAESRKAADEIYEKLNSAGVETLYDDRDERAGVKFNDADLIGVPVQVVVGEKNLKANKIELKNRLSGEKQLIEPKNIFSALKRPNIFP